MSQRLLAERQNHPRGDYVAQTINPFVLWMCYRQVSVSWHKEPCPMDDGVRPSKHSPGPHRVIAISSNFWAVRLSNTGYTGRRESKSPLLSGPWIKITA